MRMWPALNTLRAGPRGRQWARPSSFAVPPSLAPPLILRTECVAAIRGVHADDVALCLEADRFPFAMVATLEGPLMVLRPWSHDRQHRTE